MNMNSSKMVSTLKAVAVAILIVVSQLSQVSGEIFVKKCYQSIANLTVREVDCAEQVIRQHGSDGPDRINIEGCAKIKTTGRAVGCANKGFGCSPGVVQYSHDPSNKVDEELCYCNKNLCNASGSLQPRIGILLAILGISLIFGLV